MNLQIIYNQFNKDLKNIISYHNVREYDSADIEIEFYISVDKALKNGKGKTIFKDGRLNRQYLFSIIRNIVYANHNKNKMMNEEAVESLTLPFYEQDGETRVDLMLKAMDCIPSHFDRRLIKVYMTEGFTIRQMAKETKLSATTIFHSLKKSKEFIKHKIVNYYERTI